MAGHLVLSGIVGALAFVVYLSVLLLSERWSIQNVLFVALMGLGAFAAVTPLLGAFAAVIWLHHDRIEKRPILYSFVATFIAAAYVYGLGEMLAFKLPIPLLIVGAASSAIAFILLTRWAASNQIS